MNNTLLHNMNRTHTHIDVEKGEFISLPKDGTDYPPVNADINNLITYGKTTGGNGTPDNPIPLVNVSELDITSCGKNLYNINTPFDISQGGVISYPSTVDGRTMSVYNNSSLNHRNGQKLNLPKNTTVYVRAFFTKVAEDNIDYYLGVRQRNESTGYYSTQIAAKQYQEVYGWDSFSFNTGDNTDELGLFFGYSSSGLPNGTLGIKVSDITLYADTSELYYDYNGITQNIQIKDNRGLGADSLHELCSVQDGTRDEADFDSGKIVKRVIKKIYDGTENFSRSLAVFDRGQYKTFYTNLSDIPATNNVLSLYSSHFETGTAGTPDSFTAAEKNCMFTYVEGAVLRALCIKIDYHLLGIADDDAWNALTDAQRNTAFKNWLASNNVTVEYKLATPQTYQIKPYSAEFPYSQKLKSIQYHTNIFNDAGLEMQCEVRKLGNRKMSEFYWVTENGDKIITEDGDYILLEY